MQNNSQPIDSTEYDGYAGQSFWAGDSVVFFTPPASTRLVFTSSRSSTSIQSALIPLTRYHGYFHGKRSLEVDHGYNGASDLEVAPQTVPEVYHNQYTDSDQKLPYPQDTPQKTPVERGRFCGVRPLIFWILIFAIVIILAAGLGGGLGAGLSSKNSNKSSDSASSTQANILASPSAKPAHTASPTAPSQVTSAPSSTEEVSCPENDTLVYTPPAGTIKSTAYTVNSTTLTYIIYCNQSFYQSEDIRDIQHIPNFNLISCIRDCFIYNIQFSNDEDFFEF